MWYFLKISLKDTVNNNETNLKNYMHMCACARSWARKKEREQNLGYLA